MTSEQNINFHYWLRTTLMHPKYANLRIVIVSGTAESQGKFAIRKVYILVYMLVIVSPDSCGKWKLIKPATIKMTVLLQPISFPSTS